MTSRSSPFQIGMLLAIILSFSMPWWSPAIACAQDQGKYESAEEAYQAGVSYWIVKDFPNGQKAFEEALRLAPDDKKFKLQVYRHLGEIYRKATEIDKMVEAADFIITHSESVPERSLRRSDLLSFVHQRGKAKELGSRYEDRLKKNEEDMTALYVLSEIYDRWVPNAKRGVEVTERLLKLQQKEGLKIDIPTAAQLAQQQGRAGKWQEAAKLFEQIAPLDIKTSAWYWKEAAQAWLKAKDNDKALIAAKASASCRPERRSELLTYFWHKGLADTFLQTGEPTLAIGQYEQALQYTDIEGYRIDCMRFLAEAREKASKLEKK